jgi:glycosyltransferase involved in cell wall biosynthesis
MIRISVIIPTHNPHPGRLHRTLEGLRNQTLPASDWETLLVDNASTPSLLSAALAPASPGNLRILNEPELGLTNARRRGFVEAKGEFAVLVDDDNVLAADYLSRVKEHFDAHPSIGLIGGKSVPHFENPPADWTKEFHPLLALRDLGESIQISKGLRPPGATLNEYPSFAPIGAGMAIRRAAWTAWLETLSRYPGLTDRRGTDLTSGGDNDIVLSALRAGWEAGYFPTLNLTHLIPAGRLAPEYLERLNHGIQKSWMQVLARHDANPWPPLTPFGARLRQFKSWFSHRAWRSPAARIRWRGACGHFEGRTLLQTPPSP